MRHLNDTLKYVIDTLEHGSIVGKWGTSLGIASVVAPIFQILKHKVVQDSEFATTLLLCLLTDLVLGMYKHYRQGTFSWKRLYVGFLEKVGISFIGMFLFNSITSIKQLESMDTIRDYLILVGKLLNFIYVGGSAFSSCYTITNGKFPPLSFMKKLENFNKTLNIKDLKNDNNAEENI